MRVGSRTVRSATGRGKVRFTGECEWDRGVAMPGRYETETSGNDASAFRSIPARTPA